LHLLALRTRRHQRAYAFGGEDARLRDMRQGVLADRQIGEARAYPRKREDASPASTRKTACLRDVREIVLNLFQPAQTRAYTFDARLRDVRQGVLDARPTG